MRLPRMKTVLIVCHANTARSVMAHVMLEHFLRERGVHGRVRIQSGGVARYARDGMLPSLDAKIALRDLGLEVAESLVSTDLRQHPDRVAEAALIVTMTDEQKDILTSSYPEVRDTPVLTLRELAGEAGDIADPVGQSEEGFRACRVEIHRCLSLALDRLVAWASGADGLRKT
jgi:protein-tyrosine-phosphatase